jgi:Zn-dependent protease with chaperone function/uncharacterized tellurite resistance protein B-like protein
MSSDFFHQQDVARRKTITLVILFALAVVAIILSVYLLVIAVLVNYGAKTAWQPEILLWVSLGTAGVIAVGSLLKIAELAQGGEVVALMLGGRLLDPRTTDLSERKLLNVVEEMALASGVPVPPVYVLDGEKSINAFAAGHSPDNAVIGVSRGTLAYLNRDELQGVMGHEFSHILNGDMRLNLRLIGLLNGILLLAILGWYIVRSVGRSGGSSRSKGGAAGALLFGLGLMILGYVGVFFGKLIKAAVSRQREYLADAAAVQFTRYPAGIAGALKKIGGLEAGSRIEDPHAEECSHMFFGDSFSGFVNLFATHPPLASRISRLEPDFDGRFPRVEPIAMEEEAAALAGRAEALPGVGLAGRAAGRQARSIPLDPTGVLRRVGLPGVEQFLFAAAVLDGLPRPILDAAYDPYSARALVYALLLDRDAAMRKQQLDALRTKADEFSVLETQRLSALVDQLADEARQPLVDVTLPALKRLAGVQYTAFRESIETLVAADGKIDLFEYLVSGVLLRSLDVHFQRRAVPAVRYRAITPLVPPLATVISTLAYAGQDTPAEVQQAFQQGVASVGKPMALVPQEECTLTALDAALDQLAQAAPQVKKRIVGAAAACVGADGKVTPKEGALFRVVASVLGCPVTPLSPSLVGGSAPTAEKESPPSQDRQSRP